ncbi:MAG: hypothetical protein Rubg2KO_19190 [Rubricoccaceae bacterium]
MSSGSRFETDLQAVRAARGLSLAQIQQETRIPVDVLRRFEEGDLIGDPTYNEVYLKAFLKSYAKAVGTPSASVLKAYQLQQSGGYQGSLHPNYKGASSPEPPAAPVAEEPAPASVDLPDPVKAVQEQAQTPRPAAPPTSIPTQRVSRPPVPSARHSYDKNWGLIIGLFLGAIVILGGIVWFLMSDWGGASSDDTAEGPSVESVEDGQATQAAATGKRLQIPIRVTVTAGGNGLQNFRVTEAPSERVGRWIEPGASETYESDSLVVIWGEGAEGVGPEATLELQGERWTPAAGTVVRIDRQSGQRLLDSLAAAPSTPQPAPDGA